MIQHSALLGEKIDRLSYLVDERVHAANQCLTNRLYEKAREHILHGYNAVSQFIQENNGSQEFNKLENNIFVNWARLDHAEQVLKLQLEQKN